MLSEHSKTSFIFSITLLWLISAFALIWNSTTFAQDSTTFIRQVRSIETDESGILNPSSLAFSPDTNIFYVLSQNQPNAQAADIFLLTPTEDRIGSARIAAQIKDPINMTFDFTAKHLLIVASAKEMIEFGIGSGGNLNTSTPVRHDIRKFGLKNPQGMTVDLESGHLFILDATDLRIVRVEPGPGGGFDNAVITQIDLQALGLVNPRGLALDPTTGHLQAFSPRERLLYEFSQAGQLIKILNLTVIEFYNPQGMVFAPSGDLTDDPAQMSLYIADAGFGSSSNQISSAARGGQIIELSLTEPQGLNAPISGSLLASQVSASLVQVIDTSQFSPPSPDSAGIAYLSSSDTLLMSDSEVNEMPIFTGVNLFEMTLSGNLRDTMATTSFSNEPTGVAYNPANDHIFISDDSKRDIFEVNPGPDGRYDTADDIVTSFDTVVFNSTDPEGVAYDSWQGVLFIADGLNNEIYRVSPGPNGIFDGLPPGGDDIVSSFDTAVLGVNDPEGITFDTDNGLLYIVGAPSDSMAHVTREGALVRMVDISAANARKPAGLGYAPSSVNPSEMNIYITERGVDNNSDPNENDGRVYEISIPPILSGNLPPTVDAGSNAAITLPEDSVFLDATVTDDGLPDPPGAVTINWSQVSGPGTVIFDTASAEDTWVTFPEAGTYVLRLTADDGELTASDEIAIVVNQEGTVAITTEVRVAASSDDAEERAAGGMRVTSSDLELVFDGSDQTVGMRFNGVDIPWGATILNAFVQFQVDEINAVATSLMIEGEDIDDALTFTSTRGNISSRPRTGAAVAWSPAAWLVKGEAGSDQRTPNIASVIQEIVNRPGWSNGNSLAIIITGTGERTAESYNGIPAAAPLLHVEYITGTSNTAPTVSITAPANGATFNAGDPIAFSGTASDVEDGNLTTSLSWTSSLNGSIGSGGSFSNSGLSAGVHTITASVTDSGGLSGSDQIVITVNAGNTAPTVSITAPANGATFNAGDPIAFSGTASDVEDGNLTTSLSWTSSLNGSIGSGGSFSRSDLSAGVHTITASVTDSGGLSGSDQIVITVNGVGNTAPTVFINSPPNGATFNAGDSITFSGTASDVEDGNLTTSLSWTSSLNGSIGSGGSFSRSDLSAGVHTITASVTDSGGLSGSDQIVITVNGVGNTAPTVFINSPPNGATFNAGDSITFSGTASDVEDGNLTASLSWTSSLDGSIGGGGSFSRSDLSGGAHTITASVTDSGGLSGSDQIVITVNAGNTAPTVSITAPANGATFNAGDPIAFSGTASDTEDGDLTASLSWSSNRDGLIGSGGSFSNSGLSVEVHTITASVSDSGGLSGSDQIVITVNGSGEVVVTETRVAASSDDAEERATGGMRLTSSDLELVFDGSDQTVGMRFNGVDIPWGATILNAFVQFQADEIHTVATSLTIAGEDIDDALTFTSDSGNISSRPRTGTAVAWSPVGWTTVGAAGPDQRTPNIASIIQEIVNRLGWNSGNSLAIIITGTGERAAESYNGIPAAAPLLHVEYITGAANTAPTVSINSPANGATFNAGDSIAFSGTASDAEDGDLTASLSWSSDRDGSIGSGGSFSRSDLTVGVHTITASVTDSGSRSGSDQIVITVNGSGEVVVTEVRVAAGTDDAEERATGGMRLTSSDLELVFDGSDQTVGMRFNGVDIPWGATILNAFVQFQADEIHTVATSLTIEGEDIDNALTFTSASVNISSRPRTGASVAWSPAAWLVKGEAGSDQRTPNIASVIQEIVNRPGWSNGNSLVIIITGTGERAAESYNGIPAAAPLLQVEYTMIGG